MVIWSFMIYYPELKALININNNSSQGEKDSFKNSTQNIIIT